MKPLAYTQVEVLVPRISRLAKGTLLGWAVPLCLTGCLWVAVEEDDSFESAAERSRDSVNQQDRTDESPSTEVVVAPPPVDSDPVGTATVQWLIAGDADPINCALVRAASVELSVTAGQDESVARVEAPCTDFAIDLDLKPGRYTIEARLIDDSAAAVSLDLLNSARVSEDANVGLTLNFAVEDLLPNR